MANRRMINSDMFEDENFITFDDVTRLVWIGLITKCADDQGRLQDNVLLIKAQLFPADKKTTAKIEQSLEVLVKSGMLTRYEKEGKNLIQINNWWKHQTPSWASPSNYPAPECWVDKEKYHGKGKTIVSNNWDKPGGYVDEHKLMAASLHSDYVDGYVATTLELHSHDGDVNGDVNGDGEILTTTTVRARAENSEIGKIAKTYESEIGMLTGAVREALSAALEDYPTEWISEAMREAARLNKRSWKYAEGILKRWKVDGFKVDTRPKASEKPRNGGGANKSNRRTPDLTGYEISRVNEEVFIEDGYEPKSV